MRKTRQRSVLKALGRRWTPFELVQITPEMREKYPLLKRCAYIYANSRYEVQCFNCESTIGGVVQVTVHRHGNIEPIPWQDLDRIKLELFGPEATAVEIFPAVADEFQANMNIRVLWILPSTWQLPFGLHLPTAWGVTPG